MSSIIDGSAGLTTNVGAVYNGLQKGTSVASTSGTSINFTSIPSWVERITVMLNGVSTNGTDVLLCQIGTSSGIESSSYFGAYSAVNATPTASLTVSTVGFPLHQPNNAADLFYGQLIITNLSGNIWVAQGCFSRDGSASDSASAASGGKTLSGVLDRLRIIGGTAGSPNNTFDAGSINIIYE